MLIYEVAEPVRTVFAGLPMSSWSWYDPSALPFADAGCVHLPRFRLNFGETLRVACIRQRTFQLYTLLPYQSTIMSFLSANDAS